MKKKLLLTAGIVSALLFCFCTNSEEADKKYLEKFEFARKTLPVCTGESLQLEVTASLETDEIGLVFTSSDEKTATVSPEGVVRGIRAGTAEITASSRIYPNTAACKVVVSDIKVQIRPSSLEIDIFETAELEVVLTQGVRTDIAWSSEDPNIATVDAAGVVKGVGAGTTKIIATETIHNVRSECEITVRDTRPFPQGTGSESDPYILTTAQQLVRFVSLLNGEITPATEPDIPLDEACYELGAHIDMKQTAFVPAAAFKGRFNGKGYKISNLTITPRDAAPTAFFGTANGASISNLHFENLKVAVTEKAQLMTAAVTGRCENTTIDNCSVTGTIASGAKAAFVSNGASNNSCAVVGGIAAYAIGSRISNCTIDAYVSGSNQFVGGIAAVAENTRINGCTVKDGSVIACMMNHAGGIAALIRLESEISDCKVEASIKCNYAYNGGIVGKIEGGRISRCVVGSSAEVSGHVGNTSYSYVGTGGIAGLIFTTQSSSRVSISDCACYCSVSANVAAGGIAGYIRTASASDRVFITNCLFEGELAAVSKNSYNYGIAAGIAAYCHDTNQGQVHIANCAALVDGLSFLSTATAAGFGGIGGYVRYNTAFDNCYSNLEVTDIVSHDQGKPIVDYPAIIQYGGLYGVSYGASNHVSYTHCYYPDSGKTGRNLSGEPAMTECGAVTNQQMVGGELLAQLNAAATSHNATAPADAQACSWAARPDGCPVPSSVPADPSFGAASDKTRVSVIGDSISTFSGYLPAGYAAYYPTGSVVSASQTYWYKLIYDYMSHAKLDRNIAWSGTLVTRCTNAQFAGEHWYGHDFCARFIDKGMGHPDVILIHGGTNDVSGRGGVSLYPNYAIDGEAYPSDEVFAECFATADAATSRSAVEALDDTCFINAYIKLIRLIRQQYPQARVVMLVGDYISAGARQSILKIAGHYGERYGYKCVDFQNIESYRGNSVITKVSGSHPDEKGFEAMASYIYKTVGSYLD